MSSLLNIYSLPKKKSLKEETRLKIYEKVLKQCHHRIKTASNNSEEYTFYTIPNLIVGMPKFDTLSCSDYIMTKLSANGFKVLNLSTNFIFITWTHVKFNAEKERRMEEKILQLKELENCNTNNVLSIYPKTMFNNESSADINEEKNNLFKPIYDTPSTEKYLLN